MKSRLVIFLILFALILGVFEIFVRANGNYFFALSDKVLLKTAILERSTDTEVLFIGTSRFLDAIDQTQFSNTLEEKTGKYRRCFNGATAGIFGGRFTYFAKVASEKKTLTHVILEVSPPSLYKSKFILPDQIAPEAVKEEAETKFATRFENQLQNWLSQNVGLVKYRKAIQPKTLLKLVVLYTADFIDPGIWSRKGIVRNLFTSGNIEVTQEHIAKLKPEIIKPDSISAIPKNFEPNKYFSALEKVSKIFKDRDIKVIWVATPVAAKSRADSYGPQFTSQYQVIAHQYGSVFYDYAGADLTPELQRDYSHLNEKGRKIFSTILAGELARHFEAKPGN